MRKSRNIRNFKVAIAQKDGELLEACIAKACRLGIDKDYVEVFESVILETWHDRHEDIVHIVTDFKDERFTHALIKIAAEPRIYRKWDLELESTLRKCFHALKAIDSPNARQGVKDLIDSGNPNILAANEMYENGTQQIS